MKIYQSLYAAIFIILLASCAVSPSMVPIATLVMTAYPSPSRTFSPTPTHSPTPTPTLPSPPSPTPTERPVKLVFYGDSVLKVGDVSKEGSVGFSIVDVLRADLPPGDQIITSNHGGRKAKWGYENLQANVLVNKPDLVTLWWGLNDLNGCPGIFDRATNKLLLYELTAMIDDHIHYMKLQIDTFLKANIPVIVITPMPVLGTLPWSHFDKNNQLVWENDYRCDFNLGLEQLVDAQRQMVADYAAAQEPVFLVDAWQIYKDHPNSDNMYMDIVHPGQYGAEIIAGGWLQIFKSIKR
jgi:lysophospholipase L1-like esterase